NKKSFGRACTVFEVALAAQSRPAADLLAAATGLDADYELPDLLQTLAVYLPAEASGSIIRYRFVHSALAQWLANKERAGQFFVSPQRGHELGPSSNLESVLSSKTATLGVASQGTRREARRAALLGTR